MESLDASRIKFAEDQQRMLRETKATLKKLTQNDPVDFAFSMLKQAGLAAGVKRDDAGGKTRLVVFLERMPPAMIELPEWLTPTDMQAYIALKLGNLIEDLRRKEAPIA